MINAEETVIGVLAAGPRTRRELAQLPNAPAPLGLSSLLGDLRRAGFVAARPDRAWELTPRGRKLHAIREAMIVNRACTPYEEATAILEALDAVKPPRGRRR